MIKGILKNYFKNMIFVFVPMGIIYLFLLLSIIYLCDSILKEATIALTSFFTLIEDSATESGEQVEAFFNYAMGQIEWNGNFFEVLQELFDKNWIVETLQGFLKTLEVSVNDFSIQIEELGHQFIEAVQFAVGIAVGTIFIGVLIADFATRTVIRRTSARRTIKKKIIAVIVKYILDIIFLFASFFIIIFGNGFFWLAITLFFILSIGMSLLSSWFIYRNEHILLRDVVNFKNLSTHLLGSILILIIALLISISFFLINIPLAILLMLPLFIYTLNIINVNTDSYVYHLSLSSSSK